LLPLPEYITVSYTARQVEHELTKGLITLDQFNSRRYRARKQGKIEMCLDMALGYELYILNKNKEGTATCE
jgi:hypothetical protein